MPLIIRIASGDNVVSVRLPLTDKRVPMMCFDNAPVGDIDEFDIYLSEDGYRFSDLAGNKWVGSVDTGSDKVVFSCATMVKLSEMTFSEAPECRKGCCCIICV